MIFNCSRSLPGPKKPPREVLTSASVGPVSSITWVGHWFSIRAVLLPDVVISGHILVVATTWEGMLLTSNMQRPKRMFNILQCAGQSLQQRVVQSEMSTGLRLKKSEIEKSQKTLSFPRIPCFDTL